MFGLEMRELLIIGGGSLFGLIVLFGIFRALFSGGRKKSNKKSESALRETLDDYPDPPPATGKRRLLIDGLEVRMRLIVIAPAGTQRATVKPDDVAELLDDFMRGLGAAVAADKPRIRIWPPQLSATGFAPTFFRLVESPDDEGVKSQWIRLAGTMKVAGEPYLVGMAFWSEDLSKIGAMELAPNRWIDHLKIER